MYESIGSDAAGPLAFSPEDRFETYLLRKQ